MEAIYSSETSVDFQQTTRRYIPQDSTVHNHRCENLKPYIMLSNFVKTHIKHSRRVDHAHVCSKEVTVDSTEFQHVSTY
jgi:hypothetical protein